MQTLKELIEFAVDHGYTIDERIAGAVEIVGKDGKTKIVAVPDEEGNLTPGTVFVASGR